MLEFLIIRLGSRNLVLFIRPLYIGRIPADPVKCLSFGIPLLDFIHLYVVSCIYYEFIYIYI